MTRAKAWELNYQVKSFLVVQTISSPDGVLLNPCDDFLMLRKMEGTSWVQGHQDNHQADAGVNNKKTILNIRSARLDIVAAPDWFDHNSRLQMLLKAHEYSLERSWCLFSHGSNLMARLHQRRVESTKRCLDL